MQKVKIGRSQKSGNLWTRKPQPDKFGCILEASSCAGAGKQTKFVRAVFSPCGERIALADSLGMLYILDLHKNRFTQLHKGGKFCTALDFPSLNLVVAAFADQTVKVFDSGSQEVVGDLSLAGMTVTSLRHHEGGRYLLTCSPDSGALWDLTTMDRKRMLSGAGMLGLKELVFVPKSNAILTCFRDDTILGWDCETLEQLYSLGVQSKEQPAFHAFSSTSNGEFLIAGGRSRYLHVWRLQDQKLHHIVELPESVKSVRQLLPLKQIFDQNKNTIFGVLSREGILRFISLNTYKIVFTLGSTGAHVTHATASPSGKHLAVVLDSGSLQVYSVRAVTGRVNAPPAPLVKAVAVPTREVRLRVQEEAGKRRVPLREDIQQISKMDVKKLKMILKGFGEYPEKYRHFIWRLLLKVPENSEAYGVLLDKGTHRSFENLQQVCPVKSAKLMRVLQRVLSSLAHWSEVFSVSDFLPMLAFPFVKTFQNNHLVAFESIATFILNWCQGWYDYFPHPPVNVLTAIENLLNHHDSKLLQHLTNCDVSSKVYAWPLLYTVFSEVFSSQEWMVVMDHVVSNHPGYLLCLAVVYLSCSRQALMSCSDLRDFEYYFHNRNRILVSRLVSSAYTLWETCPPEIHPRSFVKPFKGLPTGDYPIFNAYPEKVVNYQLQERERIHKEELEYIKQRQVAEELRSHTAQLQQQEEVWRREQGMLAEAETQRRQILIAEENKLTQQRIRLQAMKRELRLHEVQVLDTARKNFIATADQEHRNKLLILEDEIKRKAALRDLETKGALEEVALKELEIETQKGFLEQQLARELFVSKKQQDAALDDQKERGELQRRRYDIEDGIREDRATLRVQDAQHDLARSAVKSLALKHSRDTERAKHLNAIYSELALGNIRQKEADARTEKERLETVLKDATRDIHAEILQQRAAIAQQREDTHATENRIENLYEEIQTIKGDRPGQENGQEEEVPEGGITLNKRRESLDRRHAQVLTHVQQLRNKITEDNKSAMSDTTQSSTANSDVLRYMR